MAQKRYKINVLAVSGDDIIEFDPSNTEEVAKAREQFTALADKGYEAFVGDKDPKKVTRFDEILENPAKVRVVMKPKSGGGCTLEPQYA